MPPAQKEAAPLVADTDDFNVCLLKYQKWNQEWGLEECTQFEVRIPEQMKKLLKFTRVSEEKKEGSIF